MMTYWIRVLLVSLEALVLLLTTLIWILFAEQLQSLANSLSINEDFLSFMFLAPVGIGVWVVNESRQLLQEDKESIKLLTAWPDYPKLKIHVWIGLIYSLIFAAISLASWAAQSDVSNGAGLLILLASIAGQLIVAASVYAARIRIRELLAHASAA